MTDKLVLITEEAFNQLNHKLDLLLHKSSTEDLKRNVWLTNDEVMKLLDVSKSTLQTYRDKQIIPFYQIGRKILYKATEIDEFMERFRVS